MFFKDKLSKIQEASSRKAKEKEEEKLEEDYYYHYDPKEYAETSRKVTRRETILLVLSAYLTFAPVFIVLLLILVLVY